MAGALKAISGRYTIFLPAIHIQTFMNFLSEELDNGFFYQHSFPLMEILKKIFYQFLNSSFGSNPSLEEIIG